MPIQFRCGSCQQLLCIARRKAGAIVDCPTCRQKTRVPIVKENIAPPPPSKTAGNQPVSIFDRVDVEKLLSPIVQEKGHRPLEAKSHLHPGEIELPRFNNESAHDPFGEPKSSAVNRPARKEVGSLNEDEPFTLTAAASLPTGRPCSWQKQGVIWGLGVLTLALVVFLLGHWVGAHRPLF
jgi:hypothetical protein